MVCLTNLPKQDNLTILQQYYNPKDPLKSTPHVTKLLVDNCVLPINSVILSWWSDIFQQMRDENDEIYLELQGFTGNSEQVKRCLELLHGYDVEISFENVQVILKFGLLFKIQDVAQVAVKWLKEHVDVVTQPKKKQKTSGKGKKQKTDIINTTTNFIKTLKIGLETKKFCPDFEGVLEICSQEYKNNPDDCVNQMEQEFETLCSTQFLRFLFRDIGLWKRSFVLLQIVPKSNITVEMMLEKFEDFIRRNISRISLVSGELVCLLESFNEMELTFELMRKVSKLQTQLLKTKDGEVVKISIIQDKPWRTFKEVKELFEFRKGHVLSIDEYMYVEILIDWLRHNGNYKTLDCAGKFYLLNSMNKGQLIDLYMMEKSDIFKKFGISIDNMDFSNTSTDYPEYREVDLLIWPWEPLGEWEGLVRACDIVFGDVAIPTKYNNNCKQKNTAEREDVCKTMSVSFVQHEGNKKDTQVKIEVTKTVHDHPIHICPVPNFIKLILELKTNSNSDKYISSEITTYRELEDFIRENPKCVFRIIMIFGVLP